MGGGQCDDDSSSSGDEQGVFDEEVPTNKSTTEPVVVLMPPVPPEEEKKPKPMKVIPVSREIATPSVSAKVIPEVVIDETEKQAPQLESLPLPLPPSVSTEPSATKNADAKVTVHSVAVVEHKPSPPPITFQVKIHYHLYFAEEDERTENITFSEDSMKNFIIICKHAKAIFHLSNEERFALYLDPQKRVLLRAEVLQHFINPSNNSPLHLYLLPGNFLMIPTCIIADDNFPMSRNPFRDYSAKRLFVTAMNPFHNMLDEFKDRLKVFFGERGIPDLSIYDMDKVAISVYNTEGVRHINANTLRHDELVVLKVSTSNMILKDWIKLFQAESTDSKVLSTSSTPQSSRKSEKVSFYVEEKVTPLQREELHWSPEAAKKHPNLSFDASLPSTSKSSGGLTPDQRSLKKTLSELDIDISDESIRKLSTRTSSQEGAIQYFLDNPELFVGGDHDEVDDSPKEEEVHVEQDTAHVPLIEEEVPPSVNFDSPMLNELDQHLRSFSIFLSPKNIIELSKRSSTLEGMLNVYFSNPEQFHKEEEEDNDIPISSSSASATGRSSFFEAGDYVSDPIVKECVICGDEKDMSQMYILNCSANHSFCIDCLYRQVQTSVHPSEDSAGYIPSCPYANGNGGCRHVLEQREVEEILNLSEDVDHADRDRTLKMAKKLYFIGSCRASGCVNCPNCPTDAENEGSWVEIPEGYRGSQCAVNCPRCSRSFCSVCQQSPYHFEIKCQDVITYAQRWVQWCSNGRRQYQQELSAQDAEYRRAVDARQREYEKEVREAEARLRELQETEHSLARECKMCPNCRAPIFKITGCDSMVCGRDYHGNPVGVGCGHGFAWSTAPRYEPRLNDTNQKRIELVLPEKAKQVEHLIMKGLPRCCDHCSSPIVGPLIRCINCPSYSLCFKCSSTVDFGARDHGHSNIHICEVVLESN